MLSLQGYASSDDNSDHENDETNKSIQKDEVINNENNDNLKLNEKFVPIDQSVTSLSLKICAAPEVVPTVSCFLILLKKKIILCEYC